MQPSLGLGSGYIRDNHLQTAAWAESCAVRYFLGRNWQVFTNVSGFGPVDIVCVKTQGKGKPRVMLVDVKLKTKRSYGGISDEQRWAGVRVLTVDPVDGHCTLIPEGEERLRQSRKERTKDEVDKQS